MSSSPEFPSCSPPISEEIIHWLFIYTEINQTQTVEKIYRRNDPVSLVNKCGLKNKEKVMTVVD